MNLSQQELQIIVTILTQVNLPYKDFALVKPLVEKLSIYIIKPPVQDVSVKVSDEKEDNAVT